MAQTVVNLMRRGLSDNTTFQNLNLFGCTFSPGLSLGTDDMIYWLYGCTFPGRNTGVGRLGWMNGKFLWVKTPDVSYQGNGPWVATFALDEDMTAYKRLQSWYDQLFNIQTGVIGKQPAKRDISVFLMDNTGSRKTLELVLRGCLLQGIDAQGPGSMQGPTLQMNQEEGVAPHYVQGTFTYEYQEIFFDGRKAYEYVTSRNSVFG